MKQTVNIYTFREAFNRMGRGDNFSYEGLELLFDYLEEFEQDGEEHEMDVIALCCEFAESSPADIARDYRIDTQGMSDGEVYEAAREYLSDLGVLVGETDSGVFVYRQH